MRTTILDHARATALALGACLIVGACAKKDAGTDTTTSGGAMMDSARDTTGMAGHDMTAGKIDEDNPKNDHEILVVVSHANALEISSSQLAKTNATNAAVKAFANDMIRDHSAMQKQGMELGMKIDTAGAMGMRHDSTSMMALASSDSSKLNDLAKKEKGKDWDEEYMKLQVDAHEKTLDRLKKAQENATNAELKQMLAGAIPKVQAHLDRAKKLKEQVD